MLLTIYLVTSSRLINMTISLEGLFLYSLLDKYVTTQAGGGGKEGGSSDWSVCYYRDPFRNSTPT
jgi:hypothetical protein